MLFADLAAGRVVHCKANYWFSELCGLSWPSGTVGVTLKTGKVLPPACSRRTFSLETFKYSPIQRPNWQTFNLKRLLIFVCFCGFQSRHCWMTIPQCSKRLRAKVVTDKIPAVIDMFGSFQLHQTMDILGLGGKILPQFSVSGLKVARRDTGWQLLSLTETENHTSGEVEQFLSCLE